ncbi:MAG: class I SAM-dependent methyltransferase, partial [Ignavibacteria bacterium]
QTEKFWNGIARIFDKVEKVDKKTYAQIIKKTRKYLKKSDNVLDFGCGTGLISNEIAENVSLVHAIDFSPKMIEIAEKKAFGCGIQNICYTHSTLFDDKFERGSFDVVIASYVLHLLDDSQKYIQRIIELLKPGGFFISATPCLREKPVLNFLLSFMYKIGLVPKIIPLNFSELKNLITDENFNAIETVYLHKNSAQYFIVAKKLIS